MLLGAYTSRQPVEPLTEKYDDLTMADTYEIQLLQVRRVDRGGRRRVKGPQDRSHLSGRSPGPARRRRAGLRGRCSTRWRCREGPRSIPPPRFIAPRVELELAFVLARTAARSQRYGGAGPGLNCLRAAGDRARRLPGRRLADPVARHRRRRRLLRPPSYWGLDAVHARRARSPGPPWPPELRPRVRRARRAPGHGSAVLGDPCRERRPPGSPTRSPCSAVTPAPGEVILSGRVHARWFRSGPGDPVRRPAPRTRPDVRIAPSRPSRGRAGDDGRPLTAAIVGPGNIGTDLMVKLLRTSTSSPRAWSASTRRRTAWPGPARLGVEATRGRHQLAARPARAPGHGASRRPPPGRMRPTRRATRSRDPGDRPHPGRGRPLRRPAGQPGAAPRRAQRQHGHLRRPGDRPDRARGQPRWPVPYAEIVASIASRSAGPGHPGQHRRVHRDHGRARSSEVGGAKRGKAIIILNPAEPPMIMRDTVFCALARTPTASDHRLGAARWSPRWPATSPATGCGPTRSSTARDTWTAVPGRDVPRGRGRGDYLPAVRGQPRHHDRRRGTGRGGARPTRSWPHGGQRR